MSRFIREAKPADIPEIMLVMEAAKKIMRSSGNMHQWGDGYPSEAVILSDMEKHGGFVIEDGGNVVGYFAFLLSPEPTYEKIYDGNWLDDEKPSPHWCMLPDCRIIFFAASMTCIIAAMSVGFASLIILFTLQIFNFIGSNISKVVWNRPFVKYT